MESSRPLVGVTTSEVRRAERTRPLPEGEPPQHEMALGMPYVRALARAGAVPIVLPPLRHRGRRRRCSRRWTAVCLSGGPDLDPAAYGAKPSPDLGPTEPALDAFELEVARTADAMGLPIFGICRGAQALNVARGGTLLPAPAGGHRPVGRPSPDRARAGRRRTRCASTPASRLARDPGHRRAVGELVPPPGRGPARPRAARGGVGAGRDGRGHRGPTATGSCWACSGTPRRWTGRASRTRGCSRRWSPPPAAQRLDLAA